MDDDSWEARRLDTICDLLLAYAGGAIEPSTEIFTRLGISENRGKETTEQIARWCLALPADADGPPLLLDAGKQFVNRHGEVSRDDLDFLPDHIDDLNTRSALRRAGFIVLDEFQEALVSGPEALVAHAQMVVPEGFEAGVDFQLASRLHVAAGALMARLSDAAPPACVAEEILAVYLMGVAEIVLTEMDSHLGEDERQQAVRALEGVFELCGDSDVLFMFDMKDPSDAAVAGDRLAYQVAGVADQRLEAWFDPFNYSIATGHLNETSTDEAR